MNCIDNCVCNNLSLLRVVAKVFSENYFSTFVGNVGIYSMVKDKVYQI